MTRLLIDIGNTNLRWAFQAEDEPSVGRVWEVHSVRHAGGMPLDLLAAWEQLRTPDQILVSNVAGPALGAALARVTRAYWGRAPRQARTVARFGAVRAGYADPASFGVDRWLCLIAAHARSATPTLVLDAGTAVTFDLLAADGEHLGGLILPGLTLMRTSLLSATSIPPQAAVSSGALWERDTGAAIATAAVQATAALAARLYDQASVDCSADPQLLLTGGDAEAVGAVLGRPFQLVPTLLFEGLALIADEDW